MLVLVVFVTMRMPSLSSLASLLLLPKLPSSRVKRLRCVTQQPSIAVSPTVRNQRIRCTLAIARAGAGPEPTDRHGSASDWDTRRTRGGRVRSLVFQQHPPQLLDGAMDAKSGRGGGA